eukprot:4739657-Amphidinium_carterae.2
MRPTSSVWLVGHVGIHTGRKNINYHAFKGRACQPLKHKKRAKLEAGFASVPSAEAAAEPQPSGPTVSVKVPTKKLPCVAELLTGYGLQAGVLFGPEVDRATFQLVGVLFFSILMPGLARAYSAKKIVRTSVFGFGTK